MDNREATRSGQFAPLMLAPQSGRVQPGQIQWPEFTLPTVEDLHLGTAEGGRDVPEVDQEDARTEGPGGVAAVESEVPQHLGRAAMVRIFHSFNAWNWWFLLLFIYQLFLIVLQIV